MKLKEKIIIGSLLALCLTASIRVLQGMVALQENHYVGLAHSFLQGRFDIPDLNKYRATIDIAPFNNKYFVYFGPTPAILLLPFVFILGDAISQQIIGLLLLVLDFFLIYKLAAAHKISASNSILLAIFFIFGTIFLEISLLNITSYQVQLIATSFLILALYAFFYYRKWLLIGFLLSLAATTKPTFYIASFFFLLEILLKKEYWKDKIRNIFLFSLPLIASLLMLGYYNQARFNNYFDTGYSYSSSTQATLSDALSHGLFSIEHIPGNLYFLLFKGPDPVRLNDLNYVLKFPYLQANPWGMGIFFTSPLFLYALLSKIKDKYVLSSWITISLILILTLSYVGIGIVQYGYRYAIDFYPFLFLILLSVFRNGIPRLAKILILYSLVFNFSFGLSVWGIYLFF